jgi:hypothetical protein
LAASVDPTDARKTTDPRFGRFDRHTFPRLDRWQFVGATGHRYNFFLLVRYSGPDR